MSPTLLSSRLAVPTRDFQKLLNEIAEFRSPGKYHLKPGMYKEVKVADWHHYSAVEKETVLQNARKAFTAIGLTPETKEWTSFFASLSASIPQESPPAPSPMGWSDRSSSVSSISSLDPSTTLKVVKHEEQSIAQAVKSRRSLDGSEDYAAKRTRETSGPTQKVAEPKSGKVSSSFVASSARKNPNGSLGNVPNGSTNERPTTRRSSAQVIKTDNGIIDIGRLSF